ncbi:MAG: response regulator, partial [Oligoflexales bacterium]|nr:response regulator [Oligoflexales bacterium]
AHNGTDGFIKATDQKPELIIIDWMMPGLSGPEVIKKMRASEVLREIPIILLTAKDDEESKKEGIKKGANAYLSKPFDEIELLSTVENLIQLKDGETKIKELNRNLTENVLKRFLPRRLVNDIISGGKIFDDRPSLKEITVLFSDLVGFTERAEELGPYAISDILNSYFARMTKAIFSNNGTIDKFLGDGIMVIFGAPEDMSNETQVTNALECAISMQKSLSEFNQELKKQGIREFSMRIGIHKGGGIVGSFGGSDRSEYTVIGPVVNMASRIEKVACPGGIFISSTVRDNITVHNWDKAGTFKIKGIGGVSLYKVVTEKPEN